MRNKAWTARGRPPGRHHSYADIRLLEYLAKISIKHGVDPDKFFNGLHDASQHQESTCGKLSIACRMRTRDYAIFLITRGQKVVAQFPMPEHILAETNPLRGFMHRLPSTRNSAQEAESNHYQIKDLRAGMRQIKIKTRVLEVSQPRLVTTRFGFYANVANALITDETGTIQLPLWNRQIHEISAGDLIKVENANVVVFRGARQLRVSRSGKLSVIKKLACTPEGL
ncbi:MAG: single-stranded DNA-binding protein [Candidatus Bathyarchaeota archaeon BA1]|nr:MAG: single-stranded DNA-binding protein [Candidatus Bathyarchaeota archaeon BA1]